MEALGTMRRLLVFLLLAAAFVGGYHVGRQPGSPDIIGWAQDAYPHVVEAGRDVVQAVTDRAGRADRAEAACADARWQQR